MSWRYTFYEAGPVKIICNGSGCQPSIRAATQNENDRLSVGPCNCYEAATMPILVNGVFGPKVYPELSSSVPPAPCIGSFQVKSCTSGGLPPQGEREGGDRAYAGVVAVPVGLLSGHQVVPSRSSAQQRISSFRATAMMAIFFRLGLPRWIRS